MENGISEHSREIFEELDVLKKHAEERERYAGVLERLAEARTLLKEMVDDHILWRDFTPIGPSEQDRKKYLLRSLAVGTVKDVEQFSIDLDCPPLEWSFCHTDEFAQFPSDVRVMLKPGLPPSDIVIALKRIIEWIERDPAILKARPTPCPTCGHRKLDDDGLEF
jgi:hypothetical protein